MKHTRIDQKTFDSVKSLLTVKKERGWKKEIARIMAMSWACVHNIEKASDYQAYEKKRESHRIGVKSKYATRDKSKKTQTNGLKPVLYTYQTEVLLSSIDQSLKGVLALLLKQEHIRQESKQSIFAWGKSNSKQV